MWISFSSYGLPTYSSVNCNEILSNIVTAHEGGLQSSPAFLAQLPSARLDAIPGAANFSGTTTLAADGDQDKARS